MAGKLKAEDVKSVLEALSGINRSLASSLESLGESQKQLDKSIKCQEYLNHRLETSSYPPDTALVLIREEISRFYAKDQSLKPVQVGFAQNESVRSGSEAAERV